MAGLVVAGSLNVDFVCTLPRLPAPGETITASSFALFPGGKGANQAYGAARLGGRVAMIGRVGQDDHGGWLTRHLAEAGVDVQAVLETPDAPTGMALIALDRTGENHIIVVPGANGRLQPDDLAGLDDLLDERSVLLLQLEVPLPTVIAAAGRARERGALVILDPAPACALPDRLLGLMDYLTPNESELAALAGSGSGTGLSRSAAAAAARTLCARGSARVLVKMGAAGAMLVTARDEHFWPAHAVTAVDATAAGDAFNAAFALALSEGMPVDRAGAFATAAAACSVQKAGAQPSMPSRAEVEALLV